MSPTGEGIKIRVASLAQLARMEEARAEIEKLLKDDPTYSVPNWASRTPFIHEKDRQHYVEGLIKAGLPK